MDKKNSQDNSTNLNPLWEHLRDKLGLDVEVDISLRVSFTLPVIDIINIGQSLQEYNDSEFAEPDRVVINELLLQASRYDVVIESVSKH